MTSACKNVAKKYTKRMSDGNTKLAKNELFLVAFCQPTKLF